MGQVLVSYQELHTSLTATIQPAFVFHNSSPHTVRVMPCATPSGSPCPAPQDPSYHRAITPPLKPGMSRPLLFWNLLDSSLATKSVTHSLLLTTLTPDDGADPAPIWSIPLSTDFIRHSFSLPVLHPSRAFAACLLTMHESKGVTYLVLQEDTAPQICVRNLTPTDLWLVERGVSGLDASPQPVPSCHEVVYEPPSLAKLYPLVYDQDIATERDKRMQKVARSVRVRVWSSDKPLEPPPSQRGGIGRESSEDRSRLGSLRARLSSTSSRASMEDLSDSFSLCRDEDKLLMVEGLGSILVSKKSSSQANRMIVSLTPVGSEPELALRLAHGLRTGSGRVVSRQWSVNVAARQIVVSLEDDTRSPDKEEEVMRLVASDVCFLHSGKDKEGEGQEGEEEGEEVRLELTVKSLRVDNMTVASSQEEFAVALLPRSEHAAPRQLIKKEFPPLVKLIIEYNPLAVFQISLIFLSVQPATFQLEDSLLKRVKSIVNTYAVPTTIHADRPASRRHATVPRLPSIPLAVLREAERDAYPVSISSLVIEQLDVYVSANVTLKAYLSCKDTVFSFARYQLTDVFSNWSEILQMVAARYVSALFMHIGWVLGSLELIGSPVTFLQSVNRGLADLVRLPYEGLTRSPGLFLVGIGQGTASFLHQFSSGALSSITNLASSIARNMERLSMDPDHMSYQDRQRRERPATHFTEGVASGVSSFALSLMSAVAGLVEQPMQSFQRMEESDGTTSTLLKGFGKGLLGVVTKPVGGAMDLVSKAGQGIMSDVGLARRLEHCELSGCVRRFVRAVERRDLVKTCGGLAR